MKENTRKLLKIIICAVIICTIAFSMYKCAPVTITDNAEKTQDTPNTMKDNEFIENIHYGKIRIDSLETLLKNIHEFKYEKNWERKRSKVTITIPDKTDRYAFFGSNEKQWLEAYKEKLKSADIIYNHNTITMPCKDEYIVMPYQMLFNLSEYKETYKKIETTRDK